MFLALLPVPSYDLVQFFSWRYGSIGEGGGGGGRAPTGPGIVVEGDGGGNGAPLKFPVGTTVVSSSSTEMICEYDMVISKTNKKKDNECVFISGA